MWIQKIAKSGGTDENCPLKTGRKVECTADLRYSSFNLLVFLYKCTCQQTVVTTWSWDLHWPCLIHPNQWAPLGLSSCESMLYTKGEVISNQFYHLKVIGFWITVV